MSDLRPLPKAPCEHQLECVLCGEEVDNAWARKVHDKLRAELEVAQNTLALRTEQTMQMQVKIDELRQALETWKRSAKMWRDRATYGDRWHSDDLGCDYIGDYKLYRLLRRGGE